ncbi:hypothetical protein OG339_20280 [Streptosporangium sp. NBC_01495]|uniref:hypothetical protein n=1 Tax=Streptosporangium sp. NBC_01495 TaxID=2903899 RepID=UPI002E350BC8|nr:hypothetical protein [Streptosporangium sp. NBC_01495]
MSKIDRMVSAIDPAAGPAEPAVSQGVYDLLEEIVATPPPHRRLSWLPGGVTLTLGRARWPVLISAVTTLAVAVAIGVGLPSGGPAIDYANAAVSIKKANDYFSVTITDPAADYRRFEEAFDAVGLNVTVKVVPVAPADVGKLIGPIIPEGFQGPGTIGVQSIEPCASAFCGKVWMPANLSQRVVFGVGRPAEPGEPYVEGVDNAHDEELLNGYAVRGKTVAAVRAELHRRGLKIGYRLLWITARTPAQTNWFDQTVPADRIEDDWIVERSRDHSSDTVDLFVIPGPGAGPAPDPRKVATPQWYDDLTD